MDKIKFEIKGICELKMDQWVEGIQPGSPEEYKKQAEKKIYTDSKGNLCIQARALKAAFKAAASELSDKKKRYSGKAMRQTVAAQLFILPNDLPILPLRKKHDGIVQDVVSRKQGKDKVTRVTSYRPLVKKWSVKGEIAFTGITKDFVKEALELAGLKYGLLSHRPEFGRFEIVKIT